MKCAKFFTVAALTLGLAVAGFGQAPGAPQPMDEIDQLAQVVNLTEDQQSKMREVLADITPQIEEIQLEAQNLQQELEDKIGPDFDEGEIRETASKFGEKMGELTALSALLQANVAQIMTDEQRQILEDQARQQEEMQRQFEQQMRQQQQQQQQQQPPQGQQQQGQRPPQAP